MDKQPHNPYSSAAKQRSIPNYLICLFFGGLVISFGLSCDQKDSQSINNLQAEQLFAFQVYPLLEFKCFSCHGEDPQELEGDFDIRSRAGMLKGGESGEPSLWPGDPKKSPIYLAASRIDEDFAMPPKVNDRLGDEQLTQLLLWIKAGAPWPDEDKRKEIVVAGGWDYKGKIPVETSGGLNDSWTDRTYNQQDLWAYYPVKQVEIPQLESRKYSNPIDAFIEDKLASYDLSSAPKADKKTLIRRVTYDLSGLPPTFEEIENFIADESPEAFEKVVDRLLSSPHYGEQWGRHWLDVVRYADSDGFANDFSRPNAWRYRDYVIRYLNEDKPYDQFVREQLAGDELDPQNPEMLIATGFLRMGPWEHTGMSVAAETRQYYLDDVSNSVGEVFLAQPLRCARCHDHKYDPIPTRDVYAIQAVFASTQFAERNSPFLANENLSLFTAEKERIVRELEIAQTEIDQLYKKRDDAYRKWYAERGLPYKKYELGWSEELQKENANAKDRPPVFWGWTFYDLGYRKVLQKRIQRLKKEMGAFDPVAFSVYNGPTRENYSGGRFNMPETLEGEYEETHILAGGSIYAKEQRVLPGSLSALTAFLDSMQLQNGKHDLEMEIPNTPDKRRTAFATWVTHPDNPFATRSIVNRVWQDHFGRGIAGNANNFGVIGEKPTHPELLDWLTHAFLKNGWSLKKLHRQILLSETWQRSSNHPDMERLKKIDPDNQYLTYFSPRRLDAEEIRDAILFASGELNTEMGGLPVRPEIHAEVALQPRHVMGAIAPAYQASPKRKQRNRRSIYNLRLRGLRDPFLEVFNRPGPDLSCEKRTLSTITPQVFMLFNDKNMRDRGVALAASIHKSTDDKMEAIQKIYHSVLKREPCQQEIKRADAYWQKMRQYHREFEPEMETYPTSIEREMFEEMTGETFTFVEYLRGYENYEPDLKMWEVDAETRAYADLAVVLINSNEFMYVY